jgi:hypothetical protein
LPYKSIFIHDFIKGFDKLPKDGILEALEKVRGSFRRKQVARKTKRIIGMEKR